ncbi:MAG: UDP-2,3-diacylglucosamine diphosphatase LpxI domain-containing protein [Alphaproteobacteria bacterium]
MRLGLVAGGGALPEAVLSRLPDQIHHCFHVGAAGDFPLGSIAGLAAAAEAAGCDTLCFIGAVDRRDFTDLDEGGRWVRDQAGADAGDSALLDALISFVEARGLAVVGVNTLCPDWLTPAGVLAGDGALVGEAFRTAGLARARALGLADRGQAVIACGTPPQWLEEDQSGTNALIARAGSDDLPAPKTLFKAAKPQQDRRIDLPAWGPDTVLRAAEAGLQALVFEAGASIAVDRERAVDLAKGHGLALIGVEA